jgi:GNAT superfamily N-acetyltransferase
MALEIRPAGPQDQAGVTEFCSRIWEGRDYVPRIWEEWISDPEGVLLVALWDEKPISVVRASFYTPGEAWLEGMRVDPDYQGRGVATAVFTELMEAVEERGAHVARLLTAWRNVEVHRMCDHLGFELCFRARNRFRPLEIGRPSGLRQLDEGEFSLARKLLARRGIGARQTATFLEISCNLYSVGGGVWLSWSAARLREHLTLGHVWVWEEGGLARAIAVVTPHRRGRPGLYVVGLLEGSGRACSALLDALSRHETIPEPDGDYPPMVRLAIPLRLNRIHRSAAAAGYRFPRQWRAEMWLFERALV